jgi:hypothetical protein
LKLQGFPRDAITDLPRISRVAGQAIAVVSRLCLLLSRILVGLLCLEISVSFLACLSFALVSFSFCSSLNILLLSLSND